MNKRRVFSWIAIVLLGGMYLACLILALIGSEAAQFWLKVSLVCTMVVPLVLYGFLVLTKANKRSGLPAGPQEEPEEPSGEGLIAREAARTVQDKAGAESDGQKGAADEN